MHRLISFLTASFLISAATSPALEVAMESFDYLALPSNDVTTDSAQSGISAWAFTSGGAQIDINSLAWEADSGAGGHLSVPGSSGIAEATATLDTSPTGPFTTYVDSGAITSDTLVMAFRFEGSNSVGATASSRIAFNLDSLTESFAFLYDGTELELQIAGSSAGSVSVLQEPALVVMQIAYSESGMDAIDVWVNPDPGIVTLPAADISGEGDLAFAEIGFSAEDIDLAVDEIGFATLATDLIPDEGSVGTGEFFNLSIRKPIEGGSLTVDPGEGDVEGGTTVTLEATADPGYVFTEFRVNGELVRSNPYTFTMEEDLLIKTEFKEIEQYNLTVRAQPLVDGTIQHTPEGSSFEQGTEITLTATPAEGATFVEWRINEQVTVNPTAKFTLNNDTTVIAVFEGDFPEPATFWGDISMNGQGFRNTGESEAAPGIGWIYDAEWPYVFSYGIGGGSWLYIADGLSENRDSFFAYTFDTEAWIWASNAWGWYYSMDGAGWQEFSR